MFASDKTGKTSFTYCAVDSKGNRSEPAEVSVKIEKFKTDMLYDDESGSLLEYPAAVLAERIFIPDAASAVCCCSRPGAA